MIERVVLAISSLLPEGRAAARESCCSSVVGLTAFVDDAPRHFADLLRLGMANVYLALSHHPKYTLFFGRKLR